MTQEEAKANKEIIMTLLVVVVVFFLLTQGSKIIKEVLEALNLKDTAAEKKAKEAEEKRKAEAEKKQPISTEWMPKDFNPYQYKLSLENLKQWYQKNRGKNKGFNIYDGLELSKMAKVLKDSIGMTRNPAFPNMSADYPEQALGQFQKCKDKNMVAQLAVKYEQLFKNDIFSMMSREFDTEHQAQVLASIYKYIDNLPVGIINLTNKQTIE